MSCQIIKGFFRVSAHSAGFHDIPRTHSCVCISVKRLLQLFFSIRKDSTILKCVLGIVILISIVGLLQVYLCSIQDHKTTILIFNLYCSSKKVERMRMSYKDTKKDKTGISNFCEFMLGFFVFVIFQLWQVYAQRFHYKSTCSIF